ncbi:uncharacterized protein VTP21DRAFT_7971 [Calcarisporiella thermophila]|uniref:uncharacterized protein n=1 Tax=Calcarisporiella thermophila TaxID=911321 RepID=UPI003742942D
MSSTDPGCFDAVSATLRMFHAAAESLPNCFSICIGLSAGIFLRGDAPTYLARPAGPPPPPSPHAPSPFQSTAEEIYAYYAVAFHVDCSRSEPSENGSRRESKVKMHQPNCASGVASSRQGHQLSNTRIGWKSRAHASLSIAQSGRRVNCGGSFSTQLGQHITPLQHLSIVHGSFPTAAPALQESTWRAAPALRFPTRLSNAYRRTLPLHPVGATLPRSADLVSEARQGPGAKPNSLLI